MSTEIVARHLHAAWMTVKMSLSEKGEVSMMSILVNRATSVIVFLPPLGLKTKDAYAHRLEELVKSTDSDLVIMMNEAWMATVPKSEVLKHERTGEPLLTVPPSQHPDRVEVVMVAWKTNDGEEGHEIRKLMRDRPGAPYLGDRIGVPGEQLQSRFFDGLFKKVQ